MKRSTCILMSEIAAIVVEPAYSVVKLKGAGDTFPLTSSAAQKARDEWGNWLNDPDQVKHAILVIDE